MLRLRGDVLYDEDFDSDLSLEAKSMRISKILEHEQPDFIEFLYLNGDDKGWNWGRNGSTNAVFLQSHARQYFRQFF